jgi:plasmid stabilization system protein ParE
MKFELRVGPRANQHIQQGSDWYDQQGENLGFKFYEEVKRALEVIQKNPYFQVRYDQMVRCIPLRKFPYMIHYVIDESNQIVFIQSVLHTSMNPKYWKDKGKNIPTMEG